MAVWNTIYLSSLENFKDFSSEYYRKDYIQKSELIRRIGTVKVGKIAYITDGEHGSPCWSDTSGIKYITAEYIKENYIEQGQFRQITEEQDRRNIRARLQSGDILIYSVGAYAGLAAVAEPHLFPANIPRSVAIIRINKKNELKSEYVATFLNSIFGKFQTLRLRAGNSQPVLALDKIKQLEIPIIEEKYQKEIQNYYQQAYKARILSQSLYHQAEELLARELQLDQLQLPNKKWYSTQYGEVLNGLRSDAEFYNPKLAQYYEHFSHVGLDLKCICDFVKVKKFSNPTYAEEGLPIITQRHLSVISPENYGDFPIADTNWCNKNTEAVLKKEDLLFYSVGAYLGKTNIWLNEDNAVFASFITLMRCKDVIDSCYLMMLLNSPFGILQSKVFQSGTSQPYIYPKDIKRFLVPNITRERKVALYDLIHKIHSAMNHSKQLLTQAKHRVEELIEQEANKYK